MRTLLAVIVAIAVLSLCGCPKTTTTSGTGTPAASGGGGGGGTTPPPEPQWTEFTSEEYGFTVSLPETPKEEKQAAQDSPAGEVKSVIYKATEKGISYAVQVISLPPGLHDNVDGAKFMKTQQDTIVASFPDATVVAEEELKLDGHPGREFDIKVPDSEKFPGGGGYKARIYFTGKTAFQLIVVSPPNQTADKADQFFESFALTAGKGTE